MNMVVIFLIKEYRHAPLINLLAANTAYNRPAFHLSKTAERPGYQKLIKPPCKDNCTIETPTRPKDQTRP